MADRDLYVNDKVHFYMSELTSHVVAESGIPTDRYHLGKIILKSFKDNPDFILQIDGATNESETNKSMLERSVRCAVCLQQMGLKQNDVITLMAPNHLDNTVPLYAALYLGVIAAPIDIALGLSELEDVFQIQKPKVVFCLKEKAQDVRSALEKLGLNSEIITFGSEQNFTSFEDFLQKCRDETAIKNFKVSNFDAENQIAVLMPTSGTTSLPKEAPLTHKNITVGFTYMFSIYKKFPQPFRMALVVSPLQWLSALFPVIWGPVMQYTRLQSSAPITKEHAYQLINKYKPTYVIMSPTMMTSLINSEDRDQCDFSCFQTIFLGGSAVDPDLVNKLKEVCTNCKISIGYGCTEVCGCAFELGDAPHGSCGKRAGYYEYRLIDTETQQDIVEPNVPGELWVKGPTVFKGYYNNANEDTFTEDGWFKTGDLFYRDKDWYFFFVERIKMLLKYRNHHVYPVELESVIRQHPGVMDVAVTGVPDPECGELPIAFVIPRADYKVNEEDIKDVVKKSLTDSKQLRGGVVFVKEFPLTPSSKINRKKLREMALQYKK